MSLGAQLPVRLPPDVEERIQKVAIRLGTTKSSLIRMLAKTFVEQVVDAEGHVQLPPKWRKLLEAADGRASYAMSETQAAAKPAAQSSKPGKPVSYFKSRKRTKPANSKE